MIRIVRASDAILKRRILREARVHHWVLPRTGARYQGRSVRGLLQRPWREAKSMDCAVLFVAVRVGKSPDTLGSRRNGP